MSKEGALKDFLTDVLMPAISQKDREAEGDGSQTDLASWGGYRDRVRVLIENLDAVLTPRLPADEEDVNGVRLRDLAEGVTLKNCVDALLGLSGDPCFDENLADMIDVQLGGLVGT